MYQSSEYSCGSGEQKVSRRMYFHKHGRISVETSVFALYCDCTIVFFFSNSNFLYILYAGRNHKKLVILSLNVCLCVQDHLLSSSAAGIIHDEAVLSHLIRDESCPLAV